ncbi:hypothetical protein QYE76_039407 [Lolium multiflorum]|uniref:Cytochrome P450 n=1 Tax=Lolium multiflorum TaxID=4521 RepID=A0AAD8WS51_LOLMU|nr:hypothetical protein QYE76_039407 [Lolium multiflorum]
MPRWFTPAYSKKTQASKLGDAQGIPFFIDNIIRFHVGAGIPGVAPHYIPPPSTFNVLLGSYWFDNLGFILRETCRCTHHTFLLGFIVGSCELPNMIKIIYLFHVGAGIPGVAPHYIPPPSTFNVLLGSSWFDKPWFLSEGKLAAVRIIPSSWGSQRTCGNEGLIRGLCPDFIPGGVVCLQYADDTLLFLEKNNRIATDMKWVLTCFEQISGMRINYHKRELIPINVEVDECTPFLETFFFAGHDTISHLLTWTMFLLSTHPEWQEKLREEVLRECGNEVPPATCSTNSSSSTCFCWKLSDSINPKPQSEGIAEEYPRQFAPSMGSLSAQDRSSAEPVMSSAASSTPSSPSLGSPIRFGSYEFTPHSDSSRSTFSDLQGNMEMTFGTVHYNVNSEGVLRLLEPLTSRSIGPSTSSSVDLQLV